MEDTVENDLGHEIKINKKSWGKKLLYAAWIVEIIAATIGLLVAWSMGFQTYQAYTSNGLEFPPSKYFDLFLAALPFIMVAGAELLKIPFSYLVYITPQKKIKITFGIILVLVTFITFETLLTGFERQYANITTQVDIPRNKHAQVVIQIDSKNSQLKELEEFTIEVINSNVEARRIEAQKSRDEDITILNDRKDQFLASGNNELVQQKESLKADIQRKIQSRDTEIARVEKNAELLGKEEVETQKRLLTENNNQINQLLSEKGDLNSQIAQREAELGLGSFLSGDIKDWKKRIQAIDTEVSQLRAANSSLSSSVASDTQTATNNIYQKYESAISRLYEKIDEINKRIAKNTKFKTEIEQTDIKIQERRAKYSEELAKIDSYRASEVAKLATKTQRIDELSKSLEPLVEEEAKLRGELIAAYNDTQIYRIARTFYEVERGQLITEEQLSMVAKIWFGSLAGIVSLMGVFLAFGSFVLLYPKKEVDAANDSNNGGNHSPNGNKSPISKAFRKTFLAFRKRLKEPKIITKKVEIEVPKEIVKEVPVDKVVFKEVPVEVVQKEVIHTPIYTNDPDLLKFGTTKVKDIIKDD